MKKYFLLASLIIFANQTHALDAKDKAIDIPLPQLIGSIAGKSSGLTDHKGKIIYLDFWASWCGPCRQSFPFLNKLRNDYKEKGVEVIAINLDVDITEALAFLKDFPVDYPILLDPQGRMPSAYNVRGLPTAFLIDRKGEVFYRHLGFQERDKNWIKALIDQKLEEQPQ